MYLQPGHIFEGRYQIKGELGRGGFGTVYLAWQVNMDRHVAIKTLNLEESGQALASARERFMREVRIISKLRHPNTVTIHDFGESSMGMVYMVLEYIEGDTLKEVLNQDGSLDQQRAISITTQIAKSLSEAHRHSIVHRDLKPANIMLTTMGNDVDFVKVLDFGVAHLKDNSPDLTNAGINSEEERELIGTPRYMSPEQVRGLQLTGSSDVYSLGLMLYEMLAGEPAVRGDSTIALITQQVSPEPLQLPFLPRLNPSLQRIIRKATQKNLQERYHTVDVLTQELEQALIDIRQAQTNPFLQFNSAAMASISSYDSMSSGSIDYIQSGPSLFGAHAGGLAEETEPFQLNRNGYAPPTPAPIQSPAQTDPFAGQLERGAMHMGTQGGRSAFDAALALEATPPPQSYSNDWASSSSAPMASSASWSSPHPPLSAMNSNSSPPPPNSWTKIINANDLDDGQNIDQGYNRVDPQLASSLGADLPPPPDEMNNPFAVEPKLELEPEPRHTRRTSAIPLATGGPAKGSAGGMMFQLVLTLLTIGALLAGYYLIFVVIGAALEKVVDGPIRLFAALIAGIMVPLVPLVAEGGKRERKDVPYRGMMRFRRALVVGIAGSFASFIIVCGIFPKQVVGQLRSNPNWFMGGHTTPSQETPMQTKNREASLKIAALVESTTVKAGLMNPQDVPKTVPVAQPNRSAVPAASTKEGTADAAETTPDKPPTTDTAKPTPPAAKLTTPPPTRPIVNPTLGRRPPAATRPSNPLLSKRHKKDSPKTADESDTSKKSSKKRKTTPDAKVQDKDYVKW